MIQFLLQSKDILIQISKGFKCYTSLRVFHKTKNISGGIDNIVWIFFSKKDINVDSFLFTHEFITLDVFFSIDDKSKLRIFSGLFSDEVYLKKLFCIIAFIHIFNNLQDDMIKDIGLSTRDNVSVSVLAFLGLVLVLLVLQIAIMVFFGNTKCDICQSNLWDVEVLKEFLLNKEIFIRLLELVFLLKKRKWLNRILKGDENRTRCIKVECTIQAWNSTIFVVDFDNSGFRKIVAPIGLHLFVVKRFGLVLGRVD